MEHIHLQPFYDSPEGFTYALLFANTKRNLQASADKRRDEREMINRSPHT